jgi:hypothetical protein
MKKLFVWKNAQEMSVTFCHVWRFVHVWWNDWNFLQNQEKCEKNRKKTLTNADFRDYNEGVLERKTKGKQMSLE